MSIDFGPSNVEILKTTIILLLAFVLMTSIFLDLRIALEKSRPIYIVSCRNYWSVHWMGALRDGGLFGLYSSEKAAQ